jgi:uncharacterized protein YecT (DUF1311 family)
MPKSNARANLLSMKAAQACTALFLLQVLCPVRAQSQVADQRKAQTALHFQVSQIGKDCPDPKTTVEENGCVGKVEQKTKDDLASFLAGLRSLLQGDAGAVDRLDASQEQWQHYMQKACEAIDYFFRDGTIRSSAVTRCRIQLTRSRMQDLDVLYNSTLHL